MPSIDVAMARSLHGGVWGTLRDSMVRSVATSLSRRGVIGDTKEKVTDVRTAFSSWDNCMEASFCKWPAIAIIAIAGLIIFSILWCCIRCLCCGLSCCCSCFQCLKCCGNCCGCCDPPQGKQHKHADGPYGPPPNAGLGYRTEPPMNASYPVAPIKSYNEPVVTSYPSAPPRQYNEPPQYAEFDVPKKGDDDSLPAMPSWEGANSKKIMVEEAVEMTDLKKPAAVEQPPPVMHAQSARSNPMPQGRGPYGYPQGNGSGYLNAGAQQPDAYSPLDQGYGYNAPSNGGYSMDQSYAMGAGAGAMGAGRRSPAQAMNGYGQAPMDQSYGQQQDPYGNYDGYSNTAPAGAPQGYGGMHRSNTAGSNAPMGGVPYPTEPMARQSPGPRRTPGPPADLAYNQTGRASPALQHDYGYNQAARQSPAPQNDYGYNQTQNDYGYNQPARNSPTPQNDYGYNQTSRNAPTTQNEYGYNQPARSSPTPHNDYGNGQPGYGAPTGNNSTFSTAPERHYANQSPGPRQLAGPPPLQTAYDEPPQSPIVNNSGFDFNSGTSRPSPSPTQEKYPGYKAYQPS